MLAALPVLVKWSNIVGVVRAAHQQPVVLRHPVVSQESCSAVGSRLGWTHRHLLYHGRQQPGTKPKTCWSGDRGQRRIYCLLIHILTPEGMTASSRHLEVSDISLFIRHFMPKSWRLGDCHSLLGSSHSAPRFHDLESRNILAISSNHWASQDGAITRNHLKNFI